MAKNRDRGGKHREFLMGEPTFAPNIPPETMQAIEAEWMGQGQSRTLFVSFPLEWCGDIEMTGALFDKARQIADGKADH